MKVGRSVLVLGGLAAACSSHPSPPEEHPAAAVGAAATPLSSSEAPLPYFAQPPRLADGSVAPRRGAIQSTLAIPAAPVLRLSYWGGRVISNVNVVEVNWGPNVDATIKSQMGPFYTAIVASTYMDWLSEYDTVGINGVDGLPGSGQRIGRGTFAGSYTITPSTSATSLTNDQIAAELTAQIAAGHLPAPVTDAAGNVNSLYMFDFPADVSISLGTDTSCQQFGAYHFTTTYQGQGVPYGVHPDCAYPITTVTSVHSHELLEAVTDMEVGLISDTVATIARPGAWYWYQDQNNQGEVADICDRAGNAQVAGWTVQKEWSNTQGGCVAGAATIICDGSSPAIAGCRPCTVADNGTFCNGARPVCETDNTNHKFGQCVECTSNTQCGPATPTCKKSSDDTDDTCTGTITTCQTNMQCSGNMPICDISAQKCRMCTDKSDCGVGVCDVIKGSANQGKCVQCIGVKDCTAPNVCDAATNVCVPPPPPDAGAPKDASVPVDASQPSLPPVQDSGTPVNPVVTADAAPPFAQDNEGVLNDSSSGCSAAPSGAAPKGGALAAAAVFALALVRRRRARRS